jgi:hypothetical protein
MSCNDGNDSLTDVPPVVLPDVHGAGADKSAYRTGYNVGYMHGYGEDGPVKPMPAQYGVVQKVLYGAGKVMGHWDGHTDYYGSDKGAG